MVVPLRFELKLKASKASVLTITLGDNKMVGVRGFEPLALSPQTRCATRLRYTPNKMIDILNIYVPMDPLATKYQLILEGEEAAWDELGRWAGYEGQLAHDLIYWRNPNGFKIWRDRNPDYNTTEGHMYIVDVGRADWPLLWPLLCQNPWAVDNWFVDQYSPGELDSGYAHRAVLLRLEDFMVKWLHKQNLCSATWGAPVEQDYPD